MFSIIGALPFYRRSCPFGCIIKGAPVNQGWQWFIRYSIRFSFFPSVFTDLNSIVPYRGVVPRCISLEVRTGGDRQIQIGGQAGTNLKGRILVGDNPIALLKIENSVWFETRFVAEHTATLYHYYDYDDYRVLVASYSPWTLLLLCMYFVGTEYSVRNTLFTGYLQCVDPRLVSSFVKGYPFPPGKEGIGRFEIHNNY